jgi:hypothetical protein
METILLLRTSLVEPERNVRIHTQTQIEELKRSIEMFGQIRPVVIDEDNVVLAGNGLVRAMTELGRPEVSCLRVYGLTENQKKKLMLADNKIFSLGMDVSHIQFEFIKEIGDLDIPGFDPSVLETIIGDSSQVTDMINNYGQMDEESVKERESTPPPEVGSTADPATAPGGKYIQCPHCGERIWLP